MQTMLTLLQIIDSMFPIGGFTQSYGLESFANSRIVHDTATAAAYARNMLEHNIYYNDAAFLNKAWHIDHGNDYIKKVMVLDELCTALKAPAEIRNASEKLAIRFLKLTMELKPYPATNAYFKHIQDGSCHGHYAISFGLYARSAGISRVQALTAFYYNTLNGIVTNCAKIIPISQTAAQKILYDLQPLITALVKKQDKLDEALVGLCCIGQEIKCMQHEKLYSRIYIS